MKTLCSIAVASALLTSFPLTYAADAQKSPFEITANVALTNNYIFRGFTQTDRKPALQGGFDLTHESGFSLGVWGSNVKFLEPDGLVTFKDPSRAPVKVGPKDRADLELDVYGAYTTKFSNELGGSIGFISYNYPGSAKDLHYDTLEGNIGLSYSVDKLMDLGIKYSYTPNYFGKLGAAHYYEFNGTYKLPQDFSLGFHVARQNLDSSKSFVPSYTEYNASVAYSVNNYTFSLGYSDTSIKRTDDFDPKNIADGQVFFKVSKTF